MNAALVDTGPLVALFVRNDPDHARVVAWLRAFRGKLLTTWPVLTEVCHFLSPEVALRFLRWVEGGGAGLIELPANELAAVIHSMEKYLDRPMDLADVPLTVKNNASLPQCVFADSGTLVAWEDSGCS